MCTDLLYVEGVGRPVAFGSVLIFLVALSLLNPSTRCLHKIHFKVVQSRQQQLRSGRKEVSNHTQYCDVANTACVSCVFCSSLVLEICCIFAHSGEFGTLLPLFRSLYALCIAQAPVFEMPTFK
jgi:hypothetical protein